MDHHSGNISPYGGFDHPLQSPWQTGKSHSSNSALYNEAVSINWITLASVLTDRREEMLVQDRAVRVRRHFHQG